MEKWRKGHCEWKNCKVEEITEDEMENNCSWNNDCEWCNQNTKSSEFEG